MCTTCVRACVCVRVCVRVCAREVKYVWRRRRGKGGACACVCMRVRARACACVRVRVKWNMCGVDGEEKGVRKVQMGCGENVVLGGRCMSREVRLILPAAH